MERCPQCDKPLEPCGSCPQCGEYAAPAQGTPEPPKVEEIARKLHAFLDSPTFKDSGKHPEACLADFLRRYFPPASQTPRNVQEIACNMAQELLDETRVRHKVQWCWPGLVHVSEKIEKAIRLATPASTARTDGWVSVEESLPQIETYWQVIAEGYARPLTAKFNEFGRFSSLPGAYGLQVTHYRPLPAPPTGAAQPGDAPQKETP